MGTKTISLHRVFTAPPERIYRAFLEPEAMCRWLPPKGFTATVHHMDARVGGGYRMSFTNFGAKKGLRSEGSISNWSPMRGSSTPTNSTTQIYRER